MHLVQLLLILKMLQFPLKWILLMDWSWLKSHYNQHQHQFNRSPLTTLICILASFVCLHEKSCDVAAPWQCPVSLYGTLLCCLHPSAGMYFGMFDAHHVQCPSRTFRTKSYLQMWWLQSCSLFLWSQDLFLRIYYPQWGSRCPTAELV